MSGKEKNLLWRISDWVKGDKVVWMIILMLFLFSIVCIFSSTSRLLKNDLTRLDLVKDQLMVVLGGLIIVIAIYFIKNINIFRYVAFAGFPLSFILLFLLLIHINTPFLRAPKINGVWRVLSVMGFQVHVFEIVKVAMVLYLATAIDAFKQNKLPFKNLKDEWRKIIFIYIPFIVIFVMIIPGSNSSALFIGVIMFLVILFGGGNVGELSLLALSGLLVIGLCFGIYKISGGEKMSRIGTGISRVLDDSHASEKTFLEAKPGSKEYQQALDEIRQPYSAKIAIHEGGLVGKGPGQSTQRYVVPDISEDYMFSFIIEEYGLIGGVMVMALYLSLFARSIIIVRNFDEDNFARLSVAGLSLLITGQAFLHIFVNVDIGPMTGQTLPLISHGTSAFLCFCVACGVILSISRIAAKKVEAESLQSEPLMNLRDDIKDDLDALDDFESGKENGGDYAI